MRAVLNVVLVVIEGQSHKTLSTFYSFLKGEESRCGFEPSSLCLPALSLGQDGWHWLHYYSRALQSYLRSAVDGEHLPAQSVTRWLKDWSSSMQCHLRASSSTRIPTDTSDPIEAATTAQPSLSTASYETTTDGSSSGPATLTNSETLSLIGKNLFVRSTVAENQLGSLLSQQ